MIRQKLVDEATTNPYIGYSIPRFICAIGTEQSPLTIICMAKTLLSDKPPEMSNRALRIHGSDTYFSGNPVFSMCKELMLELYTSDANGI